MVLSVPTPATAPTIMSVPVPHTAATTTSEPTDATGLPSEQQAPPKKRGGSEPNLRLSPVVLPHLAHNSSRLQVQVLAGQVTLLSPRLTMPVRMKSGRKVRVLVVGGIIEFSFSRYPSLFVFLAS